METRIYLMRHAETVRPDVFHGFESDVDLGPRGERQAMAVAGVIADLRPDGLVSSNMLRARRTAAAISRACGLPVQIEPELHERKVGALQGVSVHGDTGVWPDTLQRWIGGDTAYSPTPSPTGAESFDDIRERVLPTWDRVTREFSGKSVVIVAHGIVCRVIILSIAEGYNVADWHRLGRIENASISELVSTGRNRRGGRGGRAWQAVRVGYVPDVVREINAETTPAS